MGPAMYLYEKAREVHYQDLRREVEARRLLPRLPRHRRSTSRRVADKLGVFLLKSGAWLKKFEQPPTVNATTIEDHV